VAAGAIAVSDVERGAENQQNPTIPTEAPAAISIEVVVVEHAPGQDLLTVIGTTDLLPGEIGVIVTTERNQRMPIATESAVARIDIEVDVDETAVDAAVTALERIVARVLSLTRMSAIAGLSSSSNLLLVCERRS
jgi:hypothetical protein